MKNNNLSELSNEKLIKRRDLFKGFLIGIGIVWLFMIAVMVYLFATKDMSKVSFAVFIPIFVLPVTLTPLFINVGMLNKEVKSRKL
ncbi:hypothetical protein J2X31_003370 [Flavobacterium arsenatis]|uniref:Redox-active disulfide protein 2 n=1 Tax=Flavobacterium arsenatis TaxID=1484332 RepID=A0ABU1TU20_9FLAO|nr:hypothetical protein [Flavobacterium arsenatis]MDR6969340.1 hypothetical protein [Flavobacterium arsenatis]